MNLPKTKSMLTQEMGEELVLYDPESHEAMTLNREARVVWEMCEAEIAFESAVEQLEQTLGLEPAEAILWSALQRFQKHGLLEGEVTIPEDPAFTSRRGFFKKFGALAAALPVVFTLAVPEAAWAQSGGTPLMEGVCAAGAVCYPNLMANPCAAQGAPGGLGICWTAAPGCSGGNPSPSITVCTACGPNGSWCG